MTTRFVCKRCGTTWGWLPGEAHRPAWSLRPPGAGHLREMSLACLEGRCDVREMVVLALKRWADRKLTVV